MRLFDAVRKGTLAVPSFITDLVKKLKTEWIKREMEDMKKATKRLEAAAASQAGPSLEATTGKRKADVTVNVTINTNLPGSVAFTTAKRARISASLEESSAPARQPAGKQSARRDGSSQALRRQEPASHTSPVPFCLLGQAARLSRPLALQGRICSLTHQDSEDRDYTNPFDQPPPPYQDNYEDQNRHEENHPPVQRARLASLGPLNGRYDISSRSVDEQRPENASRLNLVLTLAGPSLWGRFDLGLVEGVMYFQERPCNSSLDAVQFSWRGHEPNGPISYDDRYNKGWIKFLGDGRIEGWINHLGIYFEGHRISGQGIRSEIDAQTMKRMWDEYYMEDEYEQQNRERCGKHLPRDDQQCSVAQGGASIQHSTYGMECAGNEIGLCNFFVVLPGNLDISAKLEQVLIQQRGDYAFRFGQLNDRTTLVLDEVIKLCNDEGYSDVVGTALVPPMDIIVNRVNVLIQHSRQLFGLPAEENNDKIMVIE